MSHARHRLAAFALVAVLAPASSAMAASAPASGTPQGGIGSAWGPQYVPAHGARHAHAVKGHRVRVRHSHRHRAH